MNDDRKIADLDFEPTIPCQVMLDSSDPESGHCAARARVTMIIMCRNEHRDTGCGHTAGVALCQQHYRMLTQHQMQYTCPGCGQARCYHNITPVEACIIAHVAHHTT